MLKAKSNAKKQDLGLTITRATREARKVVDQAMGHSAYSPTVMSRYSHDLDTDTPTVVTEITFPETADMSDVALWAERVSIRSDWTSVRIVLTRKR